jgi:hypothetical protein
VRLLREYGTAGGDYVRQRDAVLPDWDSETLVKKALRTARRMAPARSLAGAGDQALPAASVTRLRV